MFSFLDTDDDGKIAVKDLLSVLSSLGQQHMKHEVQDMIHALDPTGNTYTYVYLSAIKC